RDAAVLARRRAVAAVGVVEERRLAGGDGEVAGRGRARRRREEVVEEGEGARVLPVVRDLRLGVIEVGTVRLIGRALVEAVHLAAVVVGDGGGVGVRIVAGEIAVGRFGARERGAVGLLAGGGAGRAREIHEVVVERVVLFDDDHDVADGRGAAAVGGERAAVVVAVAAGAVAAVVAAAGGEIG